MTLERWMRNGLALAPPLFAASCGGDPPVPAPSPSQPFTIGAGTGSEHGNYGSYSQAEMITAEGRHCVTYVWDRPIDSNWALRLRSASCPDKADPGRMVAIELDRMFVPLTSSEIVQHDN